jgi:hypothetical protein
MIDGMKCRFVAPFKFSNLHCIKRFDACDPTGRLIPDAASV